MMHYLKSWKKKPFWIRLLHWEYWPFSAVYIPIYPIFFLLCLRARSFFFFAAANPAIRYGGFLGESKKDIYEMIPAAMQPKTVFFRAGTDPEVVLQQLLLATCTFPLIGKPDMGGKGRGVKKLADPESVLNYARNALTDFHIQEFVPYGNEAGIFYYRFPDQPEGHISGIVHKEFLKVTGDGARTVRQLLEDNPRAILQLSELEKLEPAMLQVVPPGDEIFTVSPYGNHARGALFLDDSASVTPALARVMNELCAQIPAFHFGRLDIRYENRAQLEAGKNFYVIEVNGAGSEPTHIYDPRHSLFFAWKEIIRHWVLLFKISRTNHRAGVPYLSFSDAVKMYKTDRENSRRLSAMQNQS